VPSASLAPFRSRPFTLIWIGALVSNIGTWMESVALGYHVADTTGRAGWSAVVAGATFVPLGIVGPVGSALADRFDRRRMLIGGSLVSALVATVLAVRVGTDAASPGEIAALGFAAGCASAFTFPAFQTALPYLVPREHLLAAVGVSNAQWNLGRVLGPVFAALAMWLGGVGAALTVNAVSFLAVVAAAASVRIAQPPAVKRPVLGALADGLRFARSSPPMRHMLVVMVFTTLLAAPFIAFVPQMATVVFDGDAQITALLVTAQGIGAVIAAFTLGSATARFGLSRVMVGALAVLCPALVLYGIAPAVALAAVALAAVGLLYGYGFTSFAGTAQQHAPEEMRGRVLAVNAMVLGLLYPLGSLVQGGIADEIGLRWVTAGSGVLAVALAGYALLGRLRGAAPVDPASADPSAVDPAGAATAADATPG
jgi:MFS family permease